MFLNQLLMQYKKVPGFPAPGMTFEQLGMEPYDVLEFMLGVEKEYGVALDDAELLSVKTLEDVQDVLSRCMGNA